MRLARNRRVMGWTICLANDLRNPALDIAIVHPMVGEIERRDADFLHGIDDGKRRLIQQSIELSLQRLPGLFNFPGRLIDGRKDQRFKDLRPVSGFDALHRARCFDSFGVMRLFVQQVSEEPVSFV